MVLLVAREDCVCSSDSSLDNAISTEPDLRRANMGAEVSFGKLLSGL